MSKALQNILLYITGLGCIPVKKVSAEEGEKYYWRNEMIAVTDSMGRLIYTPTSDYSRNANALEYLLDNDREKTLIIPEGTTVYLDEVLDIGNNTTIIAEGAEIVQKKDGTGLLQHTIDGYRYDAIKNVTVVGGHWYNECNTKGTTMFRFIHGSNLQFKNVSIDCNYDGHAMTLVACKNVLVENSIMNAQIMQQKKRLSRRSSSA